jgi:DNA primase
MSLYTKDSVERTKDAVDMVELVGARTELRRVGARYTGLCPFHDERTPSFSVNAEHKLYHCFGCGESGDAIRFVQATESLDFRESVEYLAERYGVELKLEREDPREEERRRRRERLLAAVERASAFYERFLWEAEEARRAREYLIGRGLGEEVLRAFRVGYAPSAFDRVISGARRDGFGLEELAAAGLASRGEGGRLYDRFRSRIMFPLADARGRVLGFGARAVRESQRPKYLNSSENEIYAKGRQLFGIDRARAPAARAGRIVVVEGYTDVLALHHAGVPETVAIMGTALTQEQLAELSRAAGTIYLALDADSAGQEAMLRAARGAQERKVELRVVAMPDGADPAELVESEGVDAFARRLEGALSVPEFEARRVLAGAELGSARGRDRALDELRPLVAATPRDSAVRDEIVRMAADRLDVPVEYLKAGGGGPAALRRDIRGGEGSSAPRRDDWRGRGAAAPRRDERGGGQIASSGERWAGTSDHRADSAVPSPDRGSRFEAVLRSERTFLAMSLAQGGPGRELLSRVTDEHLSSAPLRRVRDHLLQHFDDPMADLPADDPATSALITEVGMLAEQEPSSEMALRLGFLQLDLKRIERELRRADEGRDFDRQKTLWRARETVRGEITERMGQTA